MEGSVTGTRAAGGMRHGLSRRRMAKGTAAWLAGGVAVACGTPSEAPAAPGGRLPKEKVTLRYMMFLGPADRQTVEQALSPFMARTPTIEVVSEVTPERDMLTKLLVSTAAGTPPDLAEPNDKMFTDLAVGDAFADLQSFINRDKAAVDMADFHPVFPAGQRWQGKQLGLPDYSGAAVMYFNKRVFERAGAPLPDERWTWDTFEDVGRTLAGDTDGDGRVDTFAHDPFVENVRWAQYFYWSHGGTIYDGWGPMAPKDTRVRIYSPQNVKALERYVKWVAGFNVIPTPAQQQGVDFWRAGKQAMRIYARTGVPDWKTYDWINQYGGVVLPPKGTARRRSRDSVRQVTVPRGVPDPEASWEVVKHLTGREALTITMAGGRTLPVRKSLEAAFVKSLQPWETARAYLDAIRHYTDPMPIPVRWYDHETLLIEHTRAAVQGQATPDAALRTLQTELERTLTTFGQ